MLIVVNAVLICALDPGVDILVTVSGQQLPKPLLNIFMSLHTLVHRPQPSELETVVLMALVGRVSVRDELRIVGYHKDVDARTLG